ncbi:MAG: deoxyribose-phosphate aldolase, partial [Clostridia bacterium]
MNSYLSKFIDHTNLKPEATSAEIEKLCKEAVDNEFATVYVNASRVSLAEKLLQGSGVGIATVVGFPLGATTMACKVFEAVEAVKNGATEIDMVINVGKLKDKDYQYVSDEIAKIVVECGVPVKAILE